MTNKIKRTEITHMTAVSQSQDVKITKIIKKE